MTALYQDHLSILQTRYENAITHFGLDCIILTSGQNTFYFQDDNSHPFHAYSGAQQWLPFSLPQETFIVIEPTKAPRLIWPIREDFWHAPNPVPEGGWQDYWTISPARKEDKWFKDLPKKCAWLGPEPQSFAQEISGLKPYLDYDKATKTPFEIEAMRQASEHAVKGHMAAQEAFRAGLSELEIYLAYLNASQQTSSQEPYPGIVGLNEHAATLHYEHKDITRPVRPLSLLIDAGASKHGYASDITRTYANTDSSDSCEFSALLADMNKMQQGLIKKVKSGVSFQSLHQDTLLNIAQILHQHKICSLSVEEQLEKSIPQFFYPHGLGHLLGLQVHDVGGHQTDKTGTLNPPPQNAPFLRLTRTLNENMVITIEPGLYFIPMLLNKMQADIPKHGCNMSLISHLQPYGGIRIEDNIVVKNALSINLTREAFHAYAAH